MKLGIVQINAELINNVLIEQLLDEMQIAKIRMERLPNHYSPVLTSMLVVTGTHEEFEDMEESAEIPTYDVTYNRDPNSDEITRDIKKHEDVYYPIVVNQRGKGGNIL